jgi:predicted hydrocarbon binding protein
MSSQTIKILWQKMFYMIEHDLPPVRSSLGDYVNTFETQKRLDYVLISNPNLTRIEYQSTLNNTKQIVEEQHEIKGLNHAMFRNFSLRDKEQALKILQVLNNNIYSPMFRKLGKGDGKLRTVDQNTRRITYEVGNCDECLYLPDVGIHSCFYFSGLLAGIFSALFQQSMGAYQSACNNEHTCNYEIGQLRENTFAEKVDTYLQTELTADSFHNVETILLGNILRSLSEKNSVTPDGKNQVHVFGYQLRMLNVLGQNPEIFSETYRKAGLRFSKHFADILRKFYHVDGEELLTDALSKYYMKQQTAKLHSVEKSHDGYLITFSESIDCAGIKKLNFKPCSFMQGEIEGIAHIATKKPIKCEIHSCRFDTGEHHCQYRLAFVEQKEDIPKWLKALQT